MRKTTFSFCLTEEMKGELTLIANKEGWNLTAVVIKALEEYLKKERYIPTDKELKSEEKKLEDEKKKGEDYFKKHMKENNLHESTPEELTAVDKMAKEMMDKEKGTVDPMLENFDVNKYFGKEVKEETKVESENEKKERLLEDEVLKSRGLTREDF